MRLRSLLLLLVIGVVLAGAACGSRDDADTSGSETAPNCTPGKRTPVESAPPAADPARRYEARIVTSEGDIVIDLDAANAPVSVGNFVGLARAGFYDCLTFHRASKGFVIQGGDPAGDGSGGPDYEVQAELPKNGYSLGSVAWAKTQVDPPGTAGSQFFIVTSDGPGLEQALNQPPYQYGYIGQVTAGLDVAQKIEGLAPANGDGPPTTPVVIEKVEITES